MGRPPFDIPFNIPFATGREGEYLQDAMSSGLLVGDGPWTMRASRLLSPLVGGGRCLMTTSCTHALEMAALLLDLEPGDEVVMPSFTFVSTANAFVLRGAVPVFVDSRPDTLNLDEKQIEAAITDRTRAIVVVHYGGIACEMDTILEIAQRHRLVVIEDNAHGLGGSYRGRPLGSIGALATQSFHATKNFQCGEGGALVINEPSYADRAEILREKGTNRAAYFRGMVDKYRWVDLGSSYLPSELNVAFLSAQLEAFDEIQTRRHQVWDWYHERLAAWAAQWGVAQPVVPDGCEHSAHLYFLQMPSHRDQSGLLAHLSEHGVLGTFHYVPLDSAPYGEKAGRRGPGGCEVTASASERLVRLPLFAALTEDQVQHVVEAVTSYRPVS